MTLNEKIDHAIALLAAAMKKSGIRQGSGFVPNPPGADPHKKLNELLAAQQPAEKPPATKAA